jgi:hypothetical protein
MKPLRIKEITYTDLVRKKITALIGIPDDIIEQGEDAMIKYVEDNAINIRHEETIDETIMDHHQGLRITR